MKKYVIAGNRTQARDWIRMDLDRRSAAGETTLSMSEYVTVNTVSSLYGVNNVSGVFYGTWKDRSDMYEILQELMYKQSANRPLLKRLHKEWEKHQSNKTSVHNPNISVFVNGILQHPADYKIVNQHITFDHPPPKGTDIKIHDGTNITHHWCNGISDSFIIAKTIKNTPNGYTIDGVIIDEFAKIDVDEEFRKQNSDLIKYIEEYDVMKTSGWGKLSASTIESILRLDSWDNEKER